MTGYEKYKEECLSKEEEPLTEQQYNFAVNQEWTLPDGRVATKEEGITLYTNCIREEPHDEGEVISFILFMGMDSAKHLIAEYINSGAFIQIFKDKYNRPGMFEIHVCGPKEFMLKNYPEFFTMLPFEE